MPWLHVTVVTYYCTTGVGRRGGCDELELTIIGWDDGTRADGTTGRGPKKPMSNVLNMVLE